METLAHTYTYEKFQFTHPGRGVTQGLYPARYPQRVSIHAPREGCDSYLCDKYGLHSKFQFTHPGRGATDLSRKLLETHEVSIHAPREGCDRHPRVATRYMIRFNSRTPGGVRPPALFPRSFSALFQFTHPGRGATRTTKQRESDHCGFNSRTPGGVRLIEDWRVARCICFNSRTPGGVRRLANRHYHTPKPFQFTHPGRGATGQAHVSSLPSIVSIHAPREGCDSHRSFSLSF